MKTISFHGAAPEYLTGIPMAGRLIVVEGTDGVGRSTHVVNLRQWLEVSGHAVVETGWTRSKLVGRTIDKAKSGHMLSPLTYTLLYACDFADRLEKEIIPALRAGYVVLADRYIYTALARCSVRGMETGWLARLFSFAPVPDLVLYLRLDAPALARRVLLSSGIDYWEAGKDMFPQMDIYDSFVAYQSRILEQFDAMCQERSFQPVDARKPIELVQDELRSAVARLLRE